MSDFFTFYGQRSVTAAWATRSPWSILKIFNPFFQLARPGSQHHLGEHQGPARRQCDQYRAAAQCTTLAAAQNSEDVNESVDVTDINDEVDADATVSDAGVVQCAEINVAADRT